MKSLHPLAAFTTLILFSVGGHAFPDDVCHFHSIKVSSDEARILTLGGVREFRCNYEVPAEMPTSDVHYNGSDKHYHGFDLYAEIYSGTVCKARYRLGYAVNDAKIPLKGNISFGWNSEKHELETVVDNGVYDWPFAASITLKDISEITCMFFENSQPEKRHSEGYDDFYLYPVAGMYGDLEAKLPYLGSGSIDTASFLQLGKKTDVKYSLVVYLYRTAGGEAPLLFNPSP